MSVEFTKEDEEFSKLIHEKIMDVIRDAFDDKKNSMNYHKLTSLLWSSLSNVVANFIISFGHANPHGLLKSFNDQVSQLIDIQRNNKNLN